MQFWSELEICVLLLLVGVLFSHFFLWNLDLLLFIMLQNIWEEMELKILFFSPKILDASWFHVTFNVMVNCPLNFMAIFSAFILYMFFILYIISVLINFIQFSEFSFCFMAHSGKNFQISFMFLIALHCFSSSWLFARTRFGVVQRPCMTAAVWWALTNSWTCWIFLHAPLLRSFIVFSVFLP